MTRAIIAVILTLSAVATSFAQRPRIPFSYIEKADSTGQFLIADDSLDGNWNDALFLQGDTLLLTNGLDGIRLPIISTAERPIADTALIHFNRDSTKLEFYNGTGWAVIDGSTGGGTMSSFTITDGTTPETITDGETITFAASGDLSVSQSAGTVTYSYTHTGDGDGIYDGSGSLPGDVVVDAGSGNQLEITSTQNGVSEAPFRVENTYSGTNQAYGIESIVSSTGSSARAIYGQVSGSGSGIRGVSVSGNGVVANTTSGTALLAQSSSGDGAVLRSDTGLPANIFMFQGDSSSIDDILRISKNTSGTAIDGIGTAIDFFSEDDSGFSRISARIASTWTDATSASRTGNIEFYATSNGGSNPTLIAELTPDGLDISTTGSIGLPSGTDAQKPAAGTAGRIRWNTDNTYLEVDNGTSWEQVPRISDTYDGWFLQANGGASTQITDAEAVNFSEGDGINITRSGNNINVETLAFASYYSDDQDVSPSAADLDNYIFYSYFFDISASSSHSDLTLPTPSVDLTNVHLIVTAVDSDPTYDVRIITGTNELWEQGSTASTRVLSNNETVQLHIISTAAGVYKWSIINSY